MPLYLALRRRPNSFTNDLKFESRLPVTIAADQKLTTREANLRFQITLLYLGNGYNGRRYIYNATIQYGS